jgi:chromosome segregation ATPase
MMTLDELRGHVADVLAAPLSDDRTLQELRSRVNGADPNQLLVAALAVARELVSQKIAELERALEDSEEERQQLEDEMQELQDRIQSFARKCETESNRR